MVHLQPISAFLPLTLTLFTLLQAPPILAQTDATPSNMRWYQNHEPQSWLPGSKQNSGPSTKSGKSSKGGKGSQSQQNSRRSPDPFEDAEGLLLAARWADAEAQTDAQLYSQKYLDQHQPHSWIPASKQNSGASGKSRQSPNSRRAVDDLVHQPLEARSLGYPFNDAAGSSNLVLRSPIADAPQPAPQEGTQMLSPVNNPLVSMCLQSTNNNMKCYTDPNFAFAPMPMGSGNPLKGGKPTNTPQAPQVQTPKARRDLESQQHVMTAEAYVKARWALAEAEADADADAFPEEDDLLLEARGLGLDVADQMHNMLSSSLVGRCEAEAEAEAEAAADPDPDPVMLPFPSGPNSPTASKQEKDYSAQQAVYKAGHPGSAGGIPP